MAGITGYGNGGWIWGQQIDAFPDKTLSRKKWAAYLQEIDAIEEEMRLQVQQEGENNLEAAERGQERRHEIWQEEWERFVIYSRANLERAVKADEKDRSLFATENQEKELAGFVENDGRFDESVRQVLSGDGARFRAEVSEAQHEPGEKEKWFPYDNLSQDGLTITYNGVTFICNDADHTICLGDISNMKDVIQIPLSKGGTLLVNKNNIADLGRAITMFSTEDIGIILRTISEYQKINSLQYEMEEDETNTMEQMVQRSSTI